MDNIFEKIKHFEKVYLCDHQEFHEDHCLQLLQFSGLKEEKITIQSYFGTVPILCQHIFVLFLTHPTSQVSS